MSELKVFQNPEFGTIRTISINGQPFFVGKDVCDILGYSNSRDALAKHVDDEDKNTVAIRDGIAGNPNQIAVNESGLYSLILSSKLPAARRFRHWVTSEVLPSIRRHGLYAIDDILANPDLGIAALQALKAEREANRALKAEVVIRDQQIADLRPKANYCDLVLSCPDALPITILAKDYGWSGKRMNAFLHDQGVQYKLRKTWILYADYADRGYTSTETYPYHDKSGNVHNSILTKWTQAGRLFIYGLMKAAGYFPLVEQESGTAAAGTAEESMALRLAGGAGQNLQEEKGENLNGEE